MFVLSRYVKGVTFFIEGIHKVTKGVKGLLFSLKGYIKL